MRGMKGERKPKPKPKPKRKRKAPRRGKIHSPGSSRQKFRADDTRASAAGVESFGRLIEGLQLRNRRLAGVNTDFENILNSLNLNIVILDRDLCLHHCTLAARDHFKLTPDDLGRPLSEIRQLAEFESTVREVKETAYPQGREVQDHEGRWFSLRVCPWNKTDGKAKGVIVALFDVDAQKRREAELTDLNLHLRDELSRRTQDEETARGVERRFRVVADSLSDMIPYADASLRILFSNRSHEQWWGVSRGGLNGRTIPDLVGPRAFERLRPYIEEALQGRRATYEGYVDYDGRPGRRYVRIDYIPDVTQTGKVAGVYIVKKDLTELKQAEEKFHAIIESAPDAVVLTDESGDITLVNSQVEILFGHKRDDLIGKPVEVLLPGDLRRKHVSHRASYLLKPEARLMGERMELVGQRKDGSRFPVEVSLSTLQTVGGKLTCAIIRDVTHQRALAQERKEAAVAGERQRLARDVHDTLAQGLTGIVVQLQAAEAALPRSPEDALGHCMRARELAQANLNEARQSVLSLTEQVQTVGLDRSLQELVDRLRTEAQIRLDLSIEGTPRRLDASIEENLLGIARQAINNAIQHSQANEIQVELAFEKGRVRLDVSDDGRGFDPSQVSRGFGLKSMRDRARQCGGKLELKSEPGKGTHVAVSVRLRTPKSQRLA